MTVIVNVVRVFRRLRQRKELGLGLVVALVAVSVLGNALCFWVFDGVEAGLGFSDALWYSVISITTIGYGDISAASPGARIGTVVFIVGLGLATFTVFLGMTVDWATNLALKGRLGMGSAIAANHIILVNFPSAFRVRRLIEELQSDSDHPGCEVVIVSDQLESLPFELPNVLFVKGSPLAEETYRRARIEDAMLAVVLATASDDPNSDAVVSSAVSVIESLRPDLRTVAECLDDRHQLLFTAVSCDAVVHGQTITDHLLAQEGHDPGISQLIETLTSNVRGDTLYSALVSRAVDTGYAELTKALLDRDVNVLCVNRGDTSHTALRGLSPEPDDRVVYVAARRLDWEALLAMAGR